jgi:FtsP/CotA-like multicopper oxidase with cupredoxin domain
MLSLFFFLFRAPLEAAVTIQCPGDTNGDGISEDPNIECMHLAAGDGFAKMSDGYDMYILGFTDVTGVPADQVMTQALLKMEIAAPTIVAHEGKNFYLTLSNVGMVMRPDLFDPHTVHWHGFPNAATIFDGEPMASLAINMQSSFTYYYKVPDPGTYIYHCHVEATEHMQMGMLGNLYVLPKQNDLADGTLLNGFTHHTGYKYVYNDGDGSTYYDVEYPIQIQTYASNFHDAHINVQPLPFAAMFDDYPTFNGRTYPDTINPTSIMNKDGNPSQKVSSLITATRGQKILLRLSSLATIDTHTLGIIGMNMKVVGKDAHILRNPAGLNLYYQTNSLALGGGESYDVILDTSAVEAGTYFLYARNLNHMSNRTQDQAGMITEIVIQ